jgi:hypothetical protein
MTCLILGVKNAVGLSTLRTLRESGRDIVVADTLQVAQGLYRDGVDAHLLDDYTVDTVGSLVDETGADVVFVSERSPARWLVDAADDIAAAGGRLALPDGDTVKTLLDKRALAEALPEATPQIYLPEDDPSFPVVIRNRVGRTEGGVPVVEDNAQLEHERRRSERREVDTIVQEHVDGDEYLVSILYDTDGSPVLITLTAICGKGWNFLGNVTALETIDDDQLLASARAVGDRLGIKGGHVKFLFREPKPGKHVLISASPLLSELQSAAVAAGHDHATSLARIATGDPVYPPSDYEPGVHAVRNTVYQSVKQGEIL